MTRLIRHRRAAAVALSALGMLAATASRASACTASTPSTQTIPVQGALFTSGDQPVVTAIVASVDAACDLTLSATVANRPGGPEFGDVLNWDIDTDNNPATGATGRFGATGLDWQFGLARGYTDAQSSSVHYPGMTEGPAPTISGPYSLTIALNTVGVGDPLHWNVAVDAVDAVTHGETWNPGAGTVPLVMSLTPPSTSTPVVTPAPTATPVPTPAPTVVTSTQMSVKSDSSGTSRAHANPARVTYVYTRSDSWTSFTKLSATRLPRRATVRTTCTGGGCPGHGSVKLSALVKRHLAVGAKVRITVAAHGYRTEVFTFTIRRNTGPAVRAS